MTRVVHVVAHSHRDREGHRTFQQSRLTLAERIDGVLAALAADPERPPFDLDGQTVVLDDYLELRPERAGEMGALIRAGRLLPGPWYVSPAAFLVSGEALVRNLLEGGRACARWGGRLELGYIPVQYGNVAQLPQIWRGFGIDAAVLWRGVDRRLGRTAFRWQAPDGSAVLGAFLPDGYDADERLPLGATALAERLRSLAEDQDRQALPGAPLLIVHGGDLQPGLGAALRQALPLLDGTYTLRLSTLPDYLAALRAAGPPELTLTGELRSSLTAPLLPGVTSARLWIKGRNAALQTLLERQAEPLAVAAAAATGERYPADELRQSWRYLLQNQAQRSIGGCGIDQVHREMVTRFDWSEQIATVLRDAALGTLAARINSAVPGAEDPRTMAITVFNGAPVAASGRLELTLRLTGEAASYELVDTEGAPVAHAWLGDRGEAPSVVELPAEEVPELEMILAQLDGNRVFGYGVLATSMRTMGDALQVEVTIGEQALLSRAELEEAARDAQALLRGPGIRRAKATVHRSAELQLAAQVQAVPACGYTTLLLRPRAKWPLRAEALPAPEQDTLPAIANQRYRVVADPRTGALTITELGSGLAIGPANVFVDGGEAGELHTHCPPANDTIVRSHDSVPEIAREHDATGERLRLRWTMHVPRRLDSSRIGRDPQTVALPIESVVSLEPGDGPVRFATRIENTAGDHRLRALFRLPFGCDHVHAADPFGSVRRAAQPEPPEGDDWAERPLGTPPQQGWVAAHAGARACVLAAPGLPEYELLPEDDGTATLALTLLRCTGWLSRGDIPDRPEHAGPPLPTPEGQCPGSFECSYALALGVDGWRALLPAVRAAQVPLCAHVATCGEGPLPSSASLVRVEPASVLHSALKGAEDGRGAIIRVYNEEEQAADATITLAFPLASARLTSLAEQDGAELPLEGTGKTLRVAVPARGIVSVRLAWAR